MQTFQNIQITRDSYEISCSTQHNMLTIHEEVRCNTQIQTNFIIILKKFKWFNIFALMETILLRAQMFLVEPIK